MAKLNIANLKKTLYYLQRNGLRETWISVRERLTETDRYFYVPCPEEELERQSCRKWDNPVTLSIVVPLYRTPEIYLNRMITSVMQQSYPHWELILADATEDHSVEETLTNQGFLTERLLENAETIAADARIHYIHLTENAGIAANTNQALPYARGEYIGLLDHDDVLTPDALYEMADAITKANDRGVRVAFAYSDEDKCNGDETKYYDPNHKEDFNYDLILSNNYICHFLVLDGWTGISGNNLASVLLCYDENSQQMVPATRISSQRLYNASLRNVPTLVSRDLDGDGIVEIPTQPDEAGLLNLSQSRRMDFIVWMDYTSSQPEKSFGLLDEETNCYIELPAEWEGNLKLTDSEEYDNAVELRTVDEDQLVLTVRLARTSANSTGWTRLGVVASRQVQAKMGPGVLLSDTNYRLSKALYLLN